MDMEKIIKGLECCLGYNDCDVEPNEDCPYKGMCLCAIALRFDVIALLKEQNTVVRCKDCKISKLEKVFKNIPTSTETVRWCELINQYVDDNWFCADGER